MSEIKVASRYAKSLIDLALEQKALEEIKGDMQLFVDTLKASSELQAFIFTMLAALFIGMAVEEHAH